MLGSWGEFGAMDSSVKINQMSSNISPKCVQGPPSDPEEIAYVHTLGGEGPRAAANYQRNRLIDKNNVMRVI